MLTPFEIKLKLSGVSIQSNGRKKVHSKRSWRSWPNGLNAKKKRLLR